MDVDQDATVTKKKLDKPDQQSDATKHDKKADKKTDTEDPKPRIVLTFRSEKPGAKSSNMKIVSTEEKHEEISPRRSSRTRAAKWDSDEDSDALISPKKDKNPSENEDASDSSQTTPKRTTQRRGKEFDNVVANAIARKEKSYHEPPPPTRLSRRLKPTAKVLANEELLIGLESQNNARLGITPEKSPEEGVRTRRSGRSRHNTQDVQQGGKKRDVSQEVVLDSENQSQVMKLKHLCELGLKAIDPETMDESSKNDDVEIIENEETEPIEIDEEGPEDEEIDDDSEVISKLLEADADSITDSDEDFSCSEEASQGRRSTRRSRRLCSSFGNIDSDRSSPVPGDDDGAPRRRSARTKRRVKVSYEDIVGSYKPQHKKSRPEKVVQVEDTHSEGDPEPASAPAGGEEGTEAVVPVDETTIIATCFCETPSNVYAAPSELTEPVFCQAIEVVDGVRVGCSHFAARAGDECAAMLRAGPRAPYLLLCALHADQLRAHMCCPACGLFCTQGIFYQCSSGHLFHLDCALPYSDIRNGPGCPHCGVYSYRWQPANRNCTKVKLLMKCSNKRIFLPDQREQCTQAYLGFSTLKDSQLDQGPVIPEDLLPSPPIDLKRLCDKPGDSDSSVEALCSAILAGEKSDELIQKMVSKNKINKHLPMIGGGTCAHAAARSGNLTALYLAQYAGAQLDATDHASRTPLMLAVLALLDKSEKKSQKKSKLTINKDADVLDEDNKESEEEDKTECKSATERPKDEDLMKVIRYLVAAGCDVNIPGPDGMTALHMAAQHGGTDVCSVILSTVAADVDPRDQGGWTPLVWAAENNHAGVVRLLLAHGADASATDAEGNAIVHWSALAGSSRALQLLLDAAPAALTALNVNTDTPLHVAARQGHYACVVILLARGARTDMENSAGELPVEVCSDACQSAISLNMQMSIAARGKDKRHRLLTNDISNGKETYPIPCVNEVDDAPAPDDFTYVTSHVTPQNVAVDYSTQSMQGCTCKDGDCSSSECECCVLSVRRWMWRGRLHPSFPYRDPPMLFECNQTCGCNAKKCGNSMVTRALRLGSVFTRTQVFRCAGGKGWGLRAAAPVPRGAPLAAYCGELLPLPAADTRAADQYMFALDVKRDLLEQCSEKVQLCVDAAQYGGAARFINHSCKPNLAPVRVFTHTRDLRLPTVALIATTDIAPGDELTFDYGDKFWSVKSKWMRCECGTAECRYPEKVEETES